MAIVYLGLGSNIGNRERHIEDALLALNKREEISIVRVADYVESEPVGGPKDQRNFLNTVTQVQVDLTPAELLDVCQDIEDEMGRRRVERWGPRLIDIDIELFGEEKISRADLKIPHLRMHERWFVLKPLCQIAPDVVHPRLDKTAAELLEALENRGKDNQ